MVFVFFLQYRKQKFFFQFIKVTKIKERTRNNHIMFDTVHGQFAIKHSNNNTLVLIEKQHLHTI